MENKKLFIVGVIGLFFIAGVFLMAYMTLQKPPTETAPAPTAFPTNKPIFPTNQIPFVPSATPIPTPTLAPDVTVGPSPDTRPVELITQVEEANRAEHPDIYLSNKLPYEGNDFVMTYSISPDGRIVFRVTSTEFSGSELQRKVAMWLLSLNLTSTQISSLQIEY